ncbi:MAG: pantoate--beta-alanine ligase [Planctomycetales bacterium]
MSNAASGKSTGLVPTMGALHEGHLSLVAASEARCDVTVVSIFVNPTQFGAGEDYDQYPRDVDGDMEKLGRVGADLVFAPAEDVVYPADHSTQIQVGPMTKSLEGRFRPHHFGGVATIVLKLFQMVPADHAFFGEKDYQQLRVVQRMASDLNIPIEVHGCPIVRDSDGLALSSRNAYLDPDQRQDALRLSQSLQLAGDLLGQGERDSQVIIGRMREHLLAAEAVRIDYVALADPLTLLPVRKVEQPVVALVAARVGQTRLIDNRTLLP